MFSRKRSWISFSVGVASFFLYILHKFFPSLFAFLLNSSPVIVCTIFLLGILLSYGELKVPENKQDDNITDTNSSLKSESFANDLGANNEERLKVKSHTGSRRSRTIILGDTWLNEVSKAGEENKVNHTDAAFVSSAEEDNKKKNSIKDKERSTEKPAEDLVKAAIAIGHDENNTTVVDVDADKSKMDHSHDSCLGSPWHHIYHKDASSDSESDEEESSNPSVGNAMPILDELHPLVSKENSDGGSVIFSPNDASDDGSAEEETENQDDDDDDDDDDDEAEEEKDDGVKVAVTWTADDQRSVLELGNSELERNRRLENLIAKQRARKAMEKNLIDLDDDVGEMLQFHGQLPSINAPRKNPFDLPYEDELIPGSAPSVLLPRLNPFDLPFELMEDEENSSQKEAAPVPPRDAHIRRHESFSIGASFFSEIKHDKRASRFKPYFGVERNESDAFYTGLHRELSGISESKLSSTMESDTVSSVADQDHEKDWYQESGSPIQHDAEPVAQDSQSLEANKSVQVDVAHLGDSMDMEQTHLATEDETSDNDSVLNSPISYAERAEVIDEEYESSSANPSEEAEEKTTEVEQIHDGSSKDSISSTKSVVANSDVLNAEEEHFHESHVVDPVYDSSPTATERSHSHSNSAQNEALDIADKGCFIAERSILSDGRTEEGLTPADGVPWAAPSSLAFVDQNESVSREISIIKELDVIGDELTRVHEDFGTPILPVLPEPAERHRLLHPSLASVDFEEAAEDS